MGKKVKGWWVDGWYYQKELFAYPDEPNDFSFGEALRAGNPDSLVAVCPGVVYPPIKQSDMEDYTAGEINAPWRGIRNSESVDGIQYHILTYAGMTWGSRQLRCPAGELAAITANITGRGGVVSWDVPFSETDGSLDPAFFDAFRSMKQILDTNPKQGLDVEVIGHEGRTVEFRSQPEKKFTVEFNGKVQEFSGAERYSMQLPEVYDEPVIVRRGEFCRICRNPGNLEVNLSKARTLRLTGPDGIQRGTVDLKWENDTWIIVVNAHAESGEKEEFTSVEVFFAGQREDRFLYCRGWDSEVPSSEGEISVAISGDVENRLFEIRVPASKIPGYLPENRCFYGDVAVRGKCGSNGTRYSLFDADIAYKSTAMYAKFNCKNVK